MIWRVAAKNVVLGLPLGANGSSASVAGCVGDMASGWATGWASVAAMSAWEVVGGDSFGFRGAANERGRCGCAEECPSAGSGWDGIEGGNGDEAESVGGAFHELVSGIESQRVVEDFGTVLVPGVVAAVVKAMVQHLVEVVEGGRCAAPRFRG